MNNSQNIQRIACFVSPHGFGHAARACAVMEAVYELNPSIEFEIFTQVPEWFFKESLSGSFSYHALLTDIGLVQKTPLIEDIPETLKRLKGFIPFEQTLIKDIAQSICKAGCSLAICDISPMGIAVAKQAGIPCVLVENFTWDWIYKGYVGRDERFRPFIECLKESFNNADYRIQTEPVCLRHNASLTTSPISRKIRESTGRVREKLGIQDKTKMVLITMGGVPSEYGFLEQLEQIEDVCFVVPGSNGQMKSRKNLIFLPHASHFFHPDLINASNAVIAKLGYSTVAEVCSAGVPLGYLARQRFPESQVLADYVGSRMKGLAIGEGEFQNGKWLSKLPELLCLERERRRGPDGAIQAARFICDLLLRA